MASLRKPASCVGCGSINLQHLFDPERWYCQTCDTVVSQRAQRIAGKCRKCGASSDDKPFKKGKNLCIDCNNIYMVEWRKKNPGWNDDQKFKKLRFENVRKHTQATPQSFIKHLWYRITRPSRKNGTRNSTNVNPKRLAILNDVQIDLQYLFDLYDMQSGYCIVSGLKMSHEIDNICSISVDRIESNKGYIPGNIQLVCQWVNKAKGSHSNEVMLAVIDEIRKLI